MIQWQELSFKKSRGAGFPEDSIDIEAVYDDGQLSGFRTVSKEEYDIHTQERIEAVQDFWVEHQKHRNWILRIKPYVVTTAKERRAA